MVLATVLLTGCGLSDLRPEAVRPQAGSRKMERRGRDLLQTSLQAVGGHRGWDRIGAAELEITDHWQGLLGNLFRPWPGNPTLLHMHYELDMRAATATFLTGRHQGESWGLDEHGTWSQQPGGDREYARREKVRFILAAYQYLFELPLRVPEAPIVLYAGKRQRDGRLYDLVFATWGQAEPHAGEDQYLLWIARDTQRIEIAQYTLRDKAGFAQGACFYRDFREVQGLTIPHVYWIATKPDKSDYVHRVEIASVQLLPAG